MIDVNWSEIKTLIDSDTVEYRHIETSVKYLIVAWDEDFKLECVIYKNSEEATEYEASYKTIGEKKVKFSESQPVVSDKGTHDFQTLISHDWTDNTTWSTTDNSVWMFEPSDSSKQMKMVKSEVQFSHDVQLSTLPIPTELYFDIWVYNPLFDINSAPTAESDTFKPGDAGNPLRFLYVRSVFASIKDVFNYGNDHFTMSAANVDGITTGVTTVKFNYDQTIILRGDQGAQVRFSLKDHVVLGGDYCTVSCVVREESIP